MTISCFLFTSHASMHRSRQPHAQRTVFVRGIVSILQRYASIARVARTRSTNSYHEDRSTSSYDGIALAPNKEKAHSVFPKSPQPTASSTPILQPNTSDFSQPPPRTHTRLRAYCEVRYARSRLPLTGTLLILYIRRRQLQCCAPEQPCHGP